MSKVSGARHRRRRRRRRRRRSARSVEPGTHGQVVGRLGWPAGEKSRPVTRAPASAQARVSRPKWHWRCTRSRPATSPRTSTSGVRGPGRVATTGRRRRSGSASGRPPARPNCADWRQQLAWPAVVSRDRRRRPVRRTAPPFESTGQLSTRSPSRSTCTPSSRSQFDGPVDRDALAVELADDPPARARPRRPAGCWARCLLLDHAGDDRLAHQLLGEGQLDPDPDHGRLPSRAGPGRASVGPGRAIGWQGIVEIARPEPVEVEGDVPVAGAVHGADDLVRRATTVARSSAGDLDTGRCRRSGAPGAAGSPGPAAPTRLGHRSKRAEGDRRAVGTREARQAAAGLSQVRRPSWRDAARTSSLVNPASTRGKTPPARRPPAGRDGGRRGRRGSPRGRWWPRSAPPGHGVERLHQQARLAVVAASASLAA